MTRWACLVALAAAACAEPQPDPALRAMSINVACGAGDRFRTDENRRRLAGLVDDVEIAALQEVDVGVERSGRVDTARAVAGLDACRSWSEVDEGLTRCDVEGASVLFGLAFQADDAFSADDAGVPGGIRDSDPSLTPTGIDRSATARFGNALIVRGHAIESAVVVALPLVSGPVDSPEYEALAMGTPAQRAAHNLKIRSSPGIEPRSALIARIGRQRSVLVTHLEAGSDVRALRLAQLQAVAALALAERSKGRSPVLLGDLNMSSDEAGETLVPAGFALARAEGADQLWVDERLEFDSGESRPTEGASDHAFAVAATVR